jgi:hypothetical protein
VKQKKKKERGKEEGRKRNNKKKSTITTLSLGDDKFLDLDEEQANQWDWRCFSLKIFHRRL